MENARKISEVIRDRTISGFVGMRMCGGSGEDFQIHYSDGPNPYNPTGVYAVVDVKLTERYAGTRGSIADFDQDNVMYKVTWRVWLAPKPAPGDLNVNTMPGIATYAMPADVGIIADSVGRVVKERLEMFQLADKEWGAGYE